MRKVEKVILFILMLCVIGCPSKEMESLDKQSTNSIQENKRIEKKNQEDTIGEEGEMISMNIKVNNQDLVAKLYDNSTTQEWSKQLPLTITMEDLHSNEKYYYLDYSLPTNAESIGKIKAGDILLFGTSCLVVFYKEHQSSYTYTRLGYIEDIDKLKQIVGETSVEFTFTIN